MLVPRTLFFVHSANDTTYLLILNSTDDTPTIPIYLKFSPPLGLGAGSPFVRSFSSATQTAIFSSPLNSGSGCFTFGTHSRSLHNLCCYRHSRPPLPVVWLLPVPSSPLLLPLSLSFFCPLSVPFAFPSIPARLGTSGWYVRLPLKFFLLLVVLGRECR